MVTGAALMRIHERRFPSGCAPWMRQFFVDVARRDLDLVGFSMARGNGKSAVAETAALGFFGELVRSGQPGDIVVMAGTFSQACIIGRGVASAAEHIGIDPADKKRWRHRDNEKTFALEHRASGAQFRCVAADLSGIDGLRPGGILVGDEPATWHSGPALLAALSTATAKTIQSKLLMIGTRGPRGNWWNQLLDGVDAPGQRLRLFAPADDCDPESSTALAAANPSMRTLDLPRREVVERQRDAARGNPLLATIFRARRLNMPESVANASDHLLTAGQWDGLPPPGPRAGPMVLGIDLGSGRALSAAVAYWPATGRCEAMACSGDTPPLDERSRTMGWPGLLERAAEDGSLVVSPGRVPSPETVLRSAFTRFGAPQAVVADTFKRDELSDGLSAVGYSGELVVRRSHERHSDLARFLRMCGLGQIRPLRSPLFDASVASARVKTGHHGGVVLRHDPDNLDDLAAALVVAAASGGRSGYAAAQAA